MKIFLLLLIFYSNISFSKNIRWDINPEHSHISFKIKYLKIAEVQGHFEEFSGQVYFDEDGELANKISISINSNSINTRNSIRDGHLVSKDFLSSKKFPSITFKSNSIKPVRPNFFSAKGPLKIKNTRNDITVSYDMSSIIKDTWNYTSRFINFKASIKRSDFNINWNKTLTGEDLLLGDRIEIYGTFQIQPFQEKTPLSKHMIPDTREIRKRERINRGEKIEDDGFANTNTDALKKDHSLIKKEKVQAHGKDSLSHRDTIWWISYIFMGLIGFFSVIILSLQGKYLFVQIWNKNYKEIGALGFLSDVIVYSIGFLYAVAMWYLGFKT